MAEQNETVFREDLPVPTQAEQDQFYNNMKSVDPDQKGIDPSRMRAFYPKGSIHYILQGLYVLIAAGRVTKKAVGVAGKQLDKYTWV